MTEPQKNSEYSNHEIDLRDLFSIFWAGKWVIITITLVSAVGGIVFALSLPNIYKAEALVAPANNEQTPQVPGQLGSLASLAGVNISEDASSKIVMAKEILKSRAFISNFIRRHNLEVQLMATNGWDFKKGKWVFDQEVYNPKTNTWLKNDEGETLAPTDWDLVKEFRQNHFSLSQSDDTGMITISIKNQSPKAAQQWTTWLVKDINEHMRAEDVQEANKRIDYLRDKIEQTSLTGMKQVFYQLIESETRTAMLANASDEYVFKTVDPAMVPEEESEPRRVLICVAATMFGGVVGIFVVIILGTTRKRKGEHSEGKAE